MNTKEKEYCITLDVFLMEHCYVKAKNKKEAIEKAIDNSRFQSEGAEYKVFEVEIDK